jgi:hypothetical protein
LTREILSESITSSDSSENLAVSIKMKMFLQNCSEVKKKKKYIYFPCIVSMHQGNLTLPGSNSSHKSFSS